MKRGGGVGHTRTHSFVADPKNDWEIEMTEWSEAGEKEVLKEVLLLYDVPIEAEPPVCAAQELMYAYCLYCSYTSSHMQ